ncbi:glycosyltransferase [Pedobacter mucosus]|uniref:glycosyltransferase n=1 Tax=Pedobacter mucosus TaxID=2895286 RepID=UPI001EE429F0|nr:glycosyltransferase [Pedobacter mucosus]UKT64384.1 glycosyltransferase [Pedobacter mucosus]
MKKVLIISPYFAPSSTADMQRIRMSLPFFKDFGWEAEVVCVAEKYTDAVFDYMLIESIPTDIRIHRIGALPKRWTRKIGLGSIALRSLWFYKSYVNRLLKKEKFDLVYFSTTQFPVCILGAYWKKKFGIPYIIDVQDPWFSNYYEGKPKLKRPRKYWFSYYLDKYLEPIAMKKVDGLISVSDAYLNDLISRYPSLSDIPSATITFGYFQKDMEIAAQHKESLKIAFNNDPLLKHIVYVGRGGIDMQKAVSLLLKAFKRGLKNDKAYFKKLRFHFIGTSYAPSGTGQKTLYPIAEKLGVTRYVAEQTNRISFYESIFNLQSANALFIPGPEKAAYTASKVYPYIMTKKPILAVFNLESSAAQAIIACNAGTAADILNYKSAIKTVYVFLKAVAEENISPTNTNWMEFEQYSAKATTKKQCEILDRVLSRNKC